MFVTVNETAAFVNAGKRRHDQVENRFIGGTAVNDATWYPFMVSLIFYSKLNRTLICIIAVCLRIK